MSNTAYRHASQGLRPHSDPNDGQHPDRATPSYSCPRRKGNEGQRRFHTGASNRAGVLRRRLDLLSVTRPVRNQLREAIREKL